MNAVKEAVSVRAWTESDVEYVFQSVARERWGHTRRDVERCWCLEPHGCFLAELESEPVGHVSTICYGKLGWIGLLIVNPEKRGKGIGTTLIQKAVDYLEQAGAETIKLEAEETAVPLYRSLGFKEEFDSLRFSGRPNRLEGDVVGDGIAQMQAEDIEGLAGLDSMCFGCVRSRVLRRLFEDDRRHCFVAKRGQRLSGYIMCREIQNAFWVGPSICENSILSGKLLKACISTVKDDNAQLRFGFPSLNGTMSNLMRMNEFAFAGKSIRMSYGKGEHRGFPERVYGIAGPEKG